MIGQVSNVPARRKEHEIDCIYLSSDLTDLCDLCSVTTDQV